MQFYCILFIDKDLQRLFERLTLKNKCMILMVLIVSSLHQVTVASGNRANDWFVKIPTQTTDHEKQRFIEAALNHATEIIKVEEDAVATAKSSNVRCSSPCYKEIEDYLFNRVERIDKEGLKTHWDQEQGKHTASSLSDAYQAMYNHTVTATRNLLAVYEAKEENYKKLQHALSKTIENEMTCDEIQAAAIAIAGKRNNKMPSYTYSAKQDYELMQEALEYHRSQKLLPNASGESSSSSAK